MYKNSGAKVKGLATTITTLVMIGSILFGLIIIVASKSFLTGLIFAVVGCFIGWLSGLMLAAFGELVENSYHIRQMLTEKLGYQEKVNKDSEKAGDDAVSDDIVREIMRRDGVGIGDAMRIANEEKRAAANNGPRKDTVCPNCGAPRKGSGLFCSHCGTRFQ